MTSLMASSPAGWDDRWGRLKEGFVGGKSGVGAATSWCVWDRLDCIGPGYLRVGP